MIRWLLRFPLVVTEDEQRAERSRLVWGYRPEHGVYVLSPLGLVNSLRRALGRPPWGIRG